MTLLFAKNPQVAGEPVAGLFTDHPNRRALNRALFQLGRRLPRVDPAVHDDVHGSMLRQQLEEMIAR